MAASVGTWSFSIGPVKSVKAQLMDGSSAVDAIENAISAFEDDIGTGVYHCGRGGLPNSDGVAQYDAAIMNGKDLAFGAVAALEGVSTPIKVARRVMSHSEHNMLVGSGARKFALSQGFKCEENNELLNRKGRIFVERMETLRATSGTNTHNPLPNSTSDTLGVIALDKNGDIAVGVSTSGMALKHPGRVGDSPLIGGGLYADNKGGAACATGDGDEILKHCPSFHIVHLMRSGLTAQAACNQVVKEIIERRGKLKLMEMGVVAMDKQGGFGAAGTLKEWEDERMRTVYYGFPYSCWSQGKDEEVRTVPSVTDRM